MSSFYLSECVEADVDDMVRIYLAAFEDDYINNFWRPKSRVTTEAMTTWVRKRFLLTLSQPELHCFKLTEGSPDGKMAAWSRWTFPYTLSDDEEEQRRIEADKKEKLKAEDPRLLYPEGSVVEICEKCFGGYDSMREKYLDLPTMYSVQFLATDPAYQRLGLGARLLRHGLDLADAEGKKTYIESTVAGHPLYLKLGWQDVDIISIDLSPWGADKDKPGVNWVMIRPPQASRGVET